MKLKIYWMITLCSTFLIKWVSSSSSPDCLCQMDKNTFGSVKPTNLDSQLVHVSPVDHIINGQNVGRLVSVNGIIMTQKNFNVMGNMKYLMLDGGQECPHGFRLLSKLDMQVINQSLKGNHFGLVTDPNQLNFPMNSYIFVDEKVYPLDFSDGPSAFDLYGAKIMVNDKFITIEKYTTKMFDQPQKTKCVMDSFQTNQDRVMKEDLVQGNKYQMNISIYNAIDYQVEITGGIKITSEGIFSYIPKNVGCFYTKIKWKMWEGSIITHCHAFMVQPIYGSAYNTTLNSNPIKETIYDMKPILREEKIHFRGGSAPIAAKPDGGAYIFHSLKDDMKLQVMEVDNSMDFIKTMDLNMYGRPLAIVATESGFVIYMQDSLDRHKSMVANFTDNGSLKWFRIIMNNGDKPSQSKEQVTFHEKDGKLAFGMQAMYRPDNGKLVIGRNRIMLIFSHYNNFKAEKNGFQGHTGDSTISLDMNGNDILLGTSWGTSHSLDQKIAYDGLQFITSSLGDAYPQQIRFTTHDGKHPSKFIDGKTGKQNRYKTFSRSHLIDGSIPGNGNGKSCGRLGGLHIIRDIKFRQYAQVYSRHACSSGLNGEVITNDKDEIGIVFFDRELNKISQHKIGDGWNVNSIKSSGYGRNIFIIYSTTTRKDKFSSEFLPNTYNVNDQCYMMLVKTDGILRSKKIKLDKCVLGNDDLVTLKDGNVAWTFVDINGKLFTYTLASPPYEDPSIEQIYETSDKDDLVPSDNSSNDNNTKGSVLNKATWILLIILNIIIQ